MLFLISMLLNRRECLEVCEYRGNGHRYIFSNLLNGIPLPFLRFSLALILIWIGALKFVDPTSIRELLAASLTFLAFNGLCTY